jgi:ATP-dependent Lhr-like helicase
MFPWLGTRSFRTLRKIMAKNADALKISNIEYEGCCYITFRYEGKDVLTFCRTLDCICKDGVDTGSLVSPGESPIFEKYDDYIPGELLRKAYAADRLRTDEVIPRVLEMYGEENEFSKNRTEKQ